jgi:uncharacterized protein (TIGR03083 family)
MTTRNADIPAETYAERERLLGLLEGLSAEQWATASLCGGWAVRDVLAHMTMPFRVRTLQMMGGLVRARFSFNRYAEREARTAAKALGEEALLALLRDNLRTPWRPPGGGEVGALSHDVIHGLDITEPLGLPAAPPERIALVLDHSDAKLLAYFGAPIAGKRFVATDAELSLGEGTPLHMPVKDILLFVTGRGGSPSATEGAAGDAPGGDR